MRRLTASWIVLAVAIGAAFGVLGVVGREVYRQAPPIPARVVTESGATLMTRDDILDGQQVWQSIGGQQIGSIWGHGAYQAPDWSADWLHREATALLERQLAGPTSGVTDEVVARARVEREMRTNRLDAATGTLVVSDERAAAMADVAAHYDALFGDVATLRPLREHYALQDGAIPDPERRRKLAAFFFWTAWACTTERPGQPVTYTNNWPHEPLVGNHPTSANVLWSILSVALLVAGAGAMAWWKAASDRAEATEAPLAVPTRDPLASLAITPSMRAVGKYCVVVIALFAVQVLLGALTAHYTVEGQSFLGFPLAKYLPYVVTRTWHIQTGLFWIATAFLATGLFLAPAVGGREPRFQRLGVNVLFGALLVVVTGSLAGEWLATRQVLGLDLSFWFGHQGYEYVDLGRAWQIALFGGLVLWLVLTVRGFWPALRVRSSMRPLATLFAGSAAAIGLFYGAGLMYSARTHLSVMEYWRWWVVHLWVEGFMEVFATAATAFLFAKLGLVRPASAARAALASTAIFLFAGIPGTFHHLYWSGTPVAVMAVGASFSALEVVPLVLIGFEALGRLGMASRADWMTTYRWPVRFLVGVAFWNLIGAGVFGFLINPPIALYYVQGLNTTPVHAHTALFGVYGLLALALVLLVLRRLRPAEAWDERPLAFAFWAMNIGLGLMVALSLLPIGLLQAQASIEHGLWWARSADLLQQPVFVTLRWMRVVGDTIFLAGVASLVVFVTKLWLPRPVKAAVAAPGGVTARAA